MSLFSASLAHVRTSAVSVAAHGHQSSATSQDSSKYSQRHQPGASDHNSTRYAAGSPTNTVNSTLSLTKATPYSTRATEKIPAPLWPLRWCRPSSPTVKNQPSSLTVQPRPLHLSLCCFWPWPLMMKHRARRQCQDCLAHRLDVCEASLDEDAHNPLAGLHPATPRVRSATSAAPAATRHCRRRVVGRGGRSLEARAAIRAACRFPSSHRADLGLVPQQGSRRVEATGAEPLWPVDSESRGRSPRGVTFRVGAE